MGMPLIDGIRQMAMTATDPHSLGRNFSSHFAAQAWNVVPVTSVIEVQYAMAPGTALVQKRHGGDGITIVAGGDAGTAEGDFASCLVWSTRPGNELPVLMIVTNNGWGISTAPVRSKRRTASSTAARRSASPARRWTATTRSPAGTPSTGDGPLPHQRRPYMLEALVSRLYGHSSSSGAPRSHEADCITLFEHKLVAARWLDRATMEQVHEEAKAEAEAAVDQAMREPQPQAEDVEKHTYAPSPVDAVYPGDYTGLPPA